MKEKRNIEKGNAVLLQVLLQVLLIQNRGQGQDHTCIEKEKKKVLIEVSMTKKNIGII